MTAGGRAYLDHNATSPMLPRVREAMAPWWGVPANPSSVHREGQAAAAALQHAREQVAALVGARATQVVFTGGATEAVHHGVWALAKSGPCVASRMEHPCVAAAVRRATGADPVAWFPDAQGRLHVDAVGLRGAGLCVMQAANHETGVVQPVADLVSAAAAQAVPVLIDGTAAVGRVPVAWHGAAGLVLSAHKLGGPVGIGALVVDEAVSADLRAWHGGSQERGRRGGTSNVAGAVGFGAACAAAQQEADRRQAHWQQLKTQLEAAVQATGGHVVGGDAPRVPTVVLATWEGLTAEALVQALDMEGVAASAGAACASGSVSASPVLEAMGHAQPDGGLRLSLGPTSTAQDVHQACAVLPVVVKRLQAALRW